MMTIWVALALVFAIVGKSAAVSHLRCNGTEYEFPGMKDTRAKCSGKSSKACELLCTYKAYGTINPDNSLNDVQSLAVINSFPEGIRGHLGGAFDACSHWAVGLPKKADDECVVFEPLFKCSTVAITRAGCEILAPSFYF